MAKKMIGDSFEFIGINFYEKYGIRMIKNDSLSPIKRKRKMKIPKRHGSYDYGARNYEDRVITIECDLTRRLTRAEVREIAYDLSRKGKLVFWDEPDKYYIGEIYSAPSIIDFPTEVMRSFDLVFECEPFAYKEPHSQPLKVGANNISYEGTVEAPTRIVITNKGTETIDDVILTITSRRR